MSKREFPKAAPAAGVLATAEGVYPARPCSAR